MQYSKLVDADIDYLKGIVGSGHIYVGDAILEDYAHDELGEARAFPEVVVEPDSTEAISAIMRYAYERNIPVTVRGSVPAYAGCVPIHGGILLSTARLNPDS